MGANGRIAEHQAKVFIELSTSDDIERTQRHAHGPDDFYNLGFLARPPIPKSTVKTVANSPIRGARKSWPDYAKCLAEADQGIRKGKPEGRAKHDDRDHSGADFRFACYAIRRGWTVAEVTNRLLAEPDSKARRLGGRGSKYAEHTVHRAALAVGAI